MTHARSIFAASLDLVAPALQICVASYGDALSTASAVFADLPEVRVDPMDVLCGAHTVVVCPGNTRGAILDADDVNAEVARALDTNLSRYPPDEAGAPATHHGRVRRAIEVDWLGELPVGAAVYVPAPRAHPKLRGILYAPTVCHGCSDNGGQAHRDGPGTGDPYLALRGALLEAARRGIRGVSCPVLCAGKGGMSIGDACRLMRDAYASVVMGTALSH